MSDLKNVLNHLDSDRDNALERLFDFLRIDSVSTDPAYAESCVKAADWLVEDLKSIGFDASRRDTTGHPMVVAHSEPVDGPRVLFYGHYDVQPVDPIDLWDRDPFDPVLEETDQGTVIRGRGASDDKGQLMTFVEACRAYKQATGSLPINITILSEGEEESSSPSLLPFLKANVEELSCDFALVCDTGMWDNNTPAITTMLRGMSTEDFTITAADKDLHSGMFGGAAMNPIRVLTKLLGKMHDETGAVTLPGFYEGVHEVPEKLAEQWQSMQFDGAGFLAGVDLSVPAGEKGYSVLEQIWARPTCDINGIWGGYNGAGFKTVLPSEAHAKVSFRLVGDQDPVKIKAAFREYLEAGLPADCSISYHDEDGAAAINMPTDAAYFEKSRQALSDEWPNDAVYVGSGGSIPIVSQFQNILGMDSVLIGFGLEDDQIHSPNEKYNLNSFQKGARSWARVLAALA